MHSFESNRVTRHTGTEFPVLRAPIGLISRAKRVAAVCVASDIVRGTVGEFWEEVDRPSNLAKGLV